MTFRSDVDKLAARLLLTIFAWLLIRPSAVAQPESASLHPSADEVMDRVAAMNDTRAEALPNYTSVRKYHLECHGLANKKAEMVVRMNYEAPDKEEFTILSESGSGTIRERVFRKLLDAERESLLIENQQRAAITRENYTFQMLEYEKGEEGEFYVLDAQPRGKNKFLFRGRIWVDAKQLAITRIEGEPAVNPSWWTEKTDFKWLFEQIGGFWLPVSNESETKVRAFGRAVLTIEYGDYQITKSRGTSVACSRRRRSVHVREMDGRPDVPRLELRSALVRRTGCACSIDPTCLERNHFNGNL